MRNFFTMQEELTLNTENEKIQSNASILIRSQYAHLVFIYLRKKCEKILGI